MSLPLEDFIDTIHSTFESHFGDLCPWDNDTLSEVHDLIEDDTDPAAISAAFEEAGIEDDIDNDFFADLSSELRELVPEPF